MSWEPGPPQMVDVLLQLLAFPAKSWARVEKLGISHVVHVRTLLHFSSFTADCKERGHIFCTVGSMIFHFSQILALLIGWQCHDSRVHLQISPFLVALPTRMARYK